ncbi:hypothetical protein ACHEIS_000356 [Campylobacter upsaliensis]|nr:hypothetical protein [Campylobacter upsaliensis]
MQILAHRGFWREKNEQNTLASLAKAFEMGFGIETDLRDGGGGGNLLLSHDIAIFFKKLFKFCIIFH